MTLPTSAAARLPDSGSAWQSAGKPDSQKALQQSSIPAPNGSHQKSDSQATAAAQTGGLSLKLRTLSPASWAAGGGNGKKGDRVEKAPASKPAAGGL